MPVDDLERLIGQHRTELGAQERMPAELGWSGLAARLGEHRAGTRVQRFRRALMVAAGLLVLIAAAWWWSARSPTPGGPLLVSDYAPELYAEERAYLTAIDEKRAALRLEPTDSTRFAPFLDELRLLDSLQRTELDELPQAGVNDRSLRALIRYYQTKLQLLEILENELRKHTEYQRRHPEQSI